MQRTTEGGEDIDETRLAMGDNCSSQMMKVHDNLPASQCITDIFPQENVFEGEKEGKEKVKIVRKSHRIEEIRRTKPSLLPQNNIFRTTQIKKEKRAIDLM